jgi:hypothetical protein
MAGLNRDVTNVVRCVVQQRAFGKRHAVKDNQAQRSASGELQKVTVRSAANAGKAGGSDSGNCVHRGFHPKN